MNEPLLSVRDLAIRFTTPVGSVDAVRGVSFDLSRGETLALVGESGSGKSVTALSILQLLQSPPASYPSGSVKLRGTEMIGAPPALLRSLRGDRAGMIFQEPMTALNPLHTVARQIGESLQLHRKLPEDKIRARTLELLELVGIDRPEMRLGAYPHQLSGGQRQRVMIAMALANDPDLLIADEPTTALDVTIQAQVLTLLRELQERLGMAMLLITHDLNIVRRVAHRVAVMTNGEIVETGPTAEIFANPQHPYTRKLLGSEPKGAPDPLKSDARELLRVNQLRAWFPIKRGLLRRTVDHVKAVDGVTLSVHAGETLGVVGESGSGKTTLGLALLRLIGSEGVVKFLGRDLQGMTEGEMRPMRREIQMVFQDPFASLSPRLSIAEIVAEGLSVHNIAPTPTAREAAIRQALVEVGLDPAAKDRYPHEFSGGQRQRVAIARALILKPKLIVLDEPTSALDRSVQAQIIELLRDLQRRHGMAYVFISHDLAVIRALSHRVMVMRNGKVVEEGASRDLFANPQHPYTQALIEAAFHA